MSLQGSGWVKTGSLARRTLDGPLASGESLARPMPPTPSIYHHGELRRVHLSERGAVCSCCGTLIPWYVT